MSDDSGWDTLAYELVALAMVLGALAGLILAYCAIHHAIFTGLDRYRAAQSSTGDPLACRVCRRRCIPDATGLCDACAETIRREMRIYRSENPYITTPPAPTPCDQGTCHRDAVISVTRRGAGEQSKVCPGCYNQGIAWGWWA